MAFHQGKEGISLQAAPYGRSVERRLASRLASRIMAGERSEGSSRTLMT